MSGPTARKSDIKVAIAMPTNKLRTLEQVTYSQHVTNKHGTVYGTVRLGLLSSELADRQANPHDIHGLLMGLLWYSPRCVKESRNTLAVIELMAYRYTNWYYPRTPSLGPTARRSDSKVAIAMSTDKLETLEQVT